MNDITKKLFYEVKVNHVSAVRKILRENKNNKNLNLDFIDSVCTPLMLATRKGHDSCVRAILEAGANPNIKNKYDNTALIDASIYGYEKCLKALLEGGADPDIKDYHGRTALIWASIGLQEKCVTTLLEAGAKPNIKTNDGSTALISASENGNVVCVRALLEYNADPNIRNNYGSTALMKAVQYGHDSCVKLLLEGGADHNIRNHQGYTAYNLTDNPNIRKMLERAMVFKQLLPFFVKKKLPKSLHLNTELLRLTTEYLFSRKRSKRLSRKNVYNNK